MIVLADSSLDSILRNASANHKLVEGGFVNLPHCLVVKFDDDGMWESTKLQVVFGWWPAVDTHIQGQTQLLGEFRALAPLAR
jgi:hypothetical protein